MNQGQFKDPLCYLCLCGTVVSPLSLVHEVVCSRLTLLQKYLINSVDPADSTEFTLGKLKYFPFTNFCNPIKKYTTFDSKKVIKVCSLLAFLCLNLINFLLGTICLHQLEFINSSGDWHHFKWHLVFLLY